MKYDIPNSPEEAEEFSKMVYEIVDEINTRQEMAVIVHLLIMLKEAVENYMGPDYTTYRGIRIYDVLNFLIDAMMNFRRTHEVHTQNTSGECTGEIDSQP